MQAIKASPPSKPPPLKLRRPGCVIGGQRRVAVALPISKSSSNLTSSYCTTQSFVPCSGFSVAPKLKTPSLPPLSSQLALLSIVFVLSTAIGAILSLVIISLPTKIAFTRLAASLNKLSNVVSEEVPGTLLSLKLSALELNELTQQLNNLRQKISSGHNGRKARGSKQSQQLSS